MRSVAGARARNPTRNQPACSVFLWFCHFLRGVPRSWAGHLELRAQGSQGAEAATPTPPSPNPPPHPQAPNTRTPPVDPESHNHPRLARPGPTAQELWSPGRGSPRLPPPATRNRTRDQLMAAEPLQSAALPTEPIAGCLSGESGRFLSQGAQRGGTRPCRRERKDSRGPRSPLPRPRLLLGRACGTPQGPHLSGLWPPPPQNGHPAGTFLSRPCSPRPETAERGPLAGQAQGQGQGQGQGQAQGQAQAQAQAQARPQASLVQVSTWRPHALRGMPAAERHCPARRPPQPLVSYTLPGSNWRPSACWADVIATRPRVPAGAQRARPPAAAGQAPTDTSNYTLPGSNWRPSACGADVIATRPRVPGRASWRVSAPLERATALAGPSPVHRGPGQPGPSQAGPGRAGTGAAPGQPRAQGPSPARPARGPGQAQAQAPAPAQAGPGPGRPRAREAPAQGGPSPGRPRPRPREAQAQGGPGPGRPRPAGPGWRGSGHAGTGHLGELSDSIWDRAEQNLGPSGHHGGVPLWLRRRSPGVC